MFKKNPLSLLVFIVVYVLLSCSPSPTSEELDPEKEPTPFNHPAKWSEEAIWYQIFVERFRNGDKNNDPTIKNMEGSWFDPFPETWSPTDWGHDWYSQEDWAVSTGLEFYRTVQMRRYGGDFQGVLDKVPYLKELGITAIYFNPINDAPSLHKFDARNYRHADVNFGPDPLGDVEIINSEIPEDPTTWKLTAADKQFFDLVDELHANDIKVVVDFSWNHTGKEFWAFKDVVENQEKSNYKDWYEIKSFDDPSTPENEFEYDGWLGVATLPDIKKIRETQKRPGHPYEGNMVEAPKQHIFNVAKKWMDPNGDGDTSDGIDGMRLDVAEHVPLGFWRDFRKHVRSINPDFYLVGENWWTSWPDTLMDPKPWVKGDIFDAVMHYQWYKPARSYFHLSEKNQNPEKFAFSMDSVFNSYPDYTKKAMMNLGASHDSPRMATSLANRTKYKYNANPKANGLYNIGPPLDSDYNLMKLFLFHQFTWIGSPHIWMGDEIGMFGGDDPDNRKPLVWEDIAYDLEKNPSFTEIEYTHKPKVRKDIHDTYKQLASLRKNNRTLIHGSYRFQNIGNSLLAYERTTDDESFLVILNTSNIKKKVNIPLDYQQESIVYLLGRYKNQILNPLSGVILRKAK
ncbi:MAG: glycoside hydrolase family 13 protein [Saprospiraceae bacterium]|nr:glycoside hydrolase family 13 protein [Saprospiraceae bacterium]